MMHKGLKHNWAATVLMFICTGLCGDKFEESPYRGRAMQSIKTESVFFDVVANEIGIRIGLNELATNIVIGNNNEIINLYPAEFIKKEEKTYVYKSNFNNKDYIIKRTVKAEPPFDEIGILNNAKHKNIVKCYGARFSKCGEYEYIFMEYLPLKSHAIPKRIEFKKLLEITIGATQALVYLHDTLNVSHNDIKADNIRGIQIGDETVWKLIDFNLSLSFSEVLKDEYCMGTGGYFPPEAAIKGTLSKNGDVWKIGVFVLYSMINHHYNHVPYVGETDEEKIASYMSFFHKKTKGLGFDEFFNQTLRQEPDMRSDAKALLEILEKAYSELTETPKEH